MKVEKIYRIKKNSELKSKKYIKNKKWWWVQDKIVNINNQKIKIQFVWN